MIPSAAVQHREKHFNLLLARELDYLQREHQQNVVRLDRFQKFVEFEYNQTQNLRRKSQYLKAINQKTDDHRGSSTVENSPTSSDIQSDLSTTTSSSTTSNRRTFHRQCYKAQRLPPLIKSPRNKRQKFGSSYSSDIENENFTLMPDPIVGISLPKITVLDRQIQTFMDALPKNQGLAKGFDNFAPLSLYSNRACIAMK